MSTNDTTFKQKASNKINEGIERGRDLKERVEEDTLDLKDRVADKVSEIKDEAGKKLQQGMDKAREVKDYVAEKGVELKDKAVEKGKEWKNDLDKKVEDIREGKDRTVEKGKEKLDEGKRKLQEGVDKARDEGKRKLQEGVDKARDVKDEGKRKLQEGMDKARDVKDDVVEKGKEKLDEGKRKVQEGFDKARDVKDDVVERGREKLSELKGEDEKPQYAGTKFDDRGIFKIKEIHDEKDIEELKRSEERRSDNIIKKEGEHILPQGEDTKDREDDDRSMAQKVVGGVKDSLLSGLDKAKEIIGIKKDDTDIKFEKEEEIDSNRDKILDELRQTSVSRPEREEGTDLRENVTEEEDKTMTEKFTDKIRHGFDKAKELIGLGSGDKEEVKDDLGGEKDELKEEDKNRQETSSMVFI